VSDPAPPLRLLVLCTGNSCRSQMAEALLRRAGDGRLEVHSAGTHPTAVNPLTIRSLAEIGLDISSARSKSMSEFLDQDFDAVVTVCDEAAEACPYFPGSGRRDHRSFRDPAAARGTDDERLAVFRAVRDEIEAWARAYAAEMLVEPR
jgi:arsenate reductase